MRGAPAPRSRHATLVEALARAADHPSGLTFVDLREQETYDSWREIHQRARIVAGALHGLGIERGDRVALVLPTSPDFVVAFFGTVLAGAVPVPLYPPLRLARLDEYHASTTRMLRSVTACLVLTDARIRLLLGHSIEAAAPRLGCRTVRELGAVDARPFEVDSGPDDLALIQYSSGSTVDPKPVVLTHRAVTAQCDILYQLLNAGDEPPRAGVSWLPLYHDMGLIGCLLVAATYPGDLVLIPPEHFLARPALWLRTIARHRATISAAPSFAFALAERRIRDEEVRDLDLSCWRMAPCGAEPVSARVLRRFAARFARLGFDERALMPVYGLAEASLAVTFSSPAATFATRRVNPVRLASDSRAGALDGAREIVSVGSPVPGVEVEVRDAGGEVLADREVGTVFVRGPSVMREYFDQPETTAAAIRDGWLDTGDLGFVDDGELYICGRAKDVIIIRGANHMPQEFEECAMRVVGVRPGCVVALGHEPPEAEGEALLILAERRRRADGTDDEGRIADDIRVRIQQLTGIRPHAVHVLAPGTLPRTSSGKLRRRETLRRYLAGELHAPGPRSAAVAATLARSMVAFARLRMRR